MDVSTSIETNVSTSLATGAQKFLYSGNSQDMNGYDRGLPCRVNKQRPVVLPKHRSFQHSSSQRTAVGAHITQGVWQQHTPCSSAGLATPVCPLMSVIRRIAGPYVRESSRTHDRSPCLTCRYSGRSVYSLTVEVSRQLCAIRVCTVCLVKT